MGGIICPACVPGVPLREEVGTGPSGTSHTLARFPMARNGGLDTRLLLS